MYIANEKLLIYLWEDIFMEHYLYFNFLMIFGIKENRPIQYIFGYCYKYICATWY